MKKSTIKIGKQITGILLDFAICVWLTSFAAAVLTLPSWVDWVGAVTIIAIYYSICKYSLGKWLFCVNKEEFSPQDYAKIAAGVVFTVLLICTFF